DVCSSDLEQLPLGRSGETPAGPGRITIERITLAEARRLAVHAQLLDGLPRATPASILKAVTHLGYLQLDPTNVVARNHLLVLWSRFGSFRLDDFDRLMWRDHSLYSTASDLPPSARRATRPVRPPAAAR